MQIVNTFVVKVRSRVRMIHQTLHQTDSVILSYLDRPV